MQPVPAADAAGTGTGSSGNSDPQYHIFTSDQNESEGSVQTTLHVTADNLAKYCKENEITAMNASGYYEYLDSLKEEGLEMAILADGIPATTSIKK